VNLDGKAWTLATHGFYLEEAEKTAREALAIITDVKEIPDEEKARRMSYIMDTLAYILMQTNNLAEALKLKTTDQYTKDMGGIFRYALLLHMLGKEDEAGSKLKTSMEHYSPSHELYLLDRYFSDSSPFVKTFDELNVRLKQN
jgi:hypothetical protein